MTKKISLWAITNDDMVLTGFKPISKNELEIIIGLDFERNHNDSEYKTQISLSLAKRYLKALTKAVEVMEKMPTRKINQREI